MDDQQRARELLAAEYERDGIAHVPDCIRREAMLTEMEHRAIRAITAALRAAPEVIRIPAGDGLDPITLYVDDAGNGSGHLTITCYADAWTCYWGSMGCELTKFVAGVGAEYLLSSMLWPNLGSTRKMTQAYVKRIAQRVIDQLAARPQGVKDGIITRVLMLANRWDEVAKTAPSQSGLMNEMARELRAVLHDDRDSVGADNA